MVEVVAISRGVYERATQAPDNYAWGGKGDELRKQTENGRYLTVCFDNDMWDDYVAGVITVGISRRIPDDSQRRFDIDDIQAFIDELKHLHKMLGNKLGDYEGRLGSCPFKDEEDRPAVGYGEFSDDFYNGSVSAMVRVFDDGAATKLLTDLSTLLQK